MGKMCTDPFHAYGKTCTDPFMHETNVDWPNVFNAKICTDIISVVHRPHMHATRSAPTLFTLIQNRALTLNKVVQDVHRLHMLATRSAPTLCTLLQKCAPTLCTVMQDVHQLHMRSSKIYTDLKCISTEMCTGLICRHTKYAPTWYAWRVNMHWPIC